MDAVAGIMNFLKIGKKENEAPEGLCPNCWGRQEYSGQFYKTIKNEQLDLNNIEEKKGWIQAYVAKNLYGIVLKENGDDLVCKQCNTIYKNI